MSDGNGVRTSVRNRRANLSAEVTSCLRDLIMSGKLLVGTRLPVEQIAKAFDVSLTPARDALIALTSEGFLHLEARRGYVVGAFRKEDLEDLFDLQAYIAGRLAARAAQSLTEAQLKQLEELQDTLESATASGDFVRLERANFQLHRLINLASGSEKLLWVLRLLTRYVPYRFYSNVESWREPSPHLHRPILEALKNRDAEAAQRHMHTHIKLAGESLTEYLEQLGHFDSMARQADDGATSSTEDLADRIRNDLAEFEFDQMEPLHMAPFVS